MEGPLPRCSGGRDAFDCGRDLLLVHFGHRQIDCEEGGHEGEADHRVKELCWELQFEWEFQEEEELSGADGCEDETNERAEDQRTDDDDVLLVEEDAGALVLAEADSSQAAVLPDVLFDVLGSRNHQKEEGQGEGDRSYHTYEYLEEAQ